MLFVSLRLWKTHSPTRYLERLHPKPTTLVGGPSHLPLPAWALPVESAHLLQKIMRSLSRITLAELRAAHVDESDMKRYHS